MTLSKYGIFLTTMAMTLLASCGGNTGTDSTDSLSDTQSFPTQMDTVMKKDTVAKTEKKLITFADREAALNYMRNSGHWDQYQSGILPRMAEENLEYCGKLLNNDFDYFIVVDKAPMKVILYSKYGNVVKEYGMACAKNYGTKHKKGDSRTPEGFFTAEGIYDSTDWLFTNDAGYTSPARGQFGPRFIRLKVPNTSQIGIHGTAAPRSIGRRVSHGCIRIKNENILELVKYAKVGMPIIVSPGPQDLTVNKREGYNIKTITTGAIKVEPAENPTATKKKTAETKKTPTTKVANDSVKVDKKVEVKEETKPTTPTEEKKPAEEHKPAKEEKPAEQQSK